MRRPALIFDFGNVLAHFDYRKACAHYARRLGITGEVFLKRLGSLGFSPLVRQYESGKLTAEAFSRGVCALAGLDISHDEFAAAWSDIFTLNEPIARLIAFLKGSGYTLVLGSNTNDLHAAQFRRQFAEPLAHFDRLILSYEIGHVKPSAPFYLACAEAAGAPPDQCVFIDDLAENVAGARAAGLMALQFRDVSRLLPELQALGVETPGIETRGEHREITEGMSINMN
jgi:glucose-1-phosphatase